MTTEQFVVAPLAPGRYRLIWKLFGVVVVLALASAGTTIGWVRADAAFKHSQVADKHSQAACQLYKNLAESTPAPATTSLGLQIIADTRTAYHQAGCTLGPLAPPDPRVLPYLPK